MFNEKAILKIGRLFCIRIGNTITQISLLCQNLIINKVNMISVKNKISRLKNIFYLSQLYKNHHDKDGKFDFKFEPQKFKRFTFGYFLVYPLVLLSLLWLIINNKSIVQLLHEQTINYLKSSKNISLLKYSSLIKSVFSSSIIVGITVSFLWIEFTNKIDKKVLKVMIILIITVRFMLMYGKNSIVYYISNLFNSFQYDINAVRSYVITISIIYNPKFLVLFSPVKFNFIKTLYFFMTFLNTNEVRLVECTLLLTVIFQVITVMISWLITREDRSLWEGITIKEYFIFLLISIVIIITTAVHLNIIGSILVILLLGMSALSDFNRILLNNSFISFISFLVVISYSNENIVMVLNIFVSAIEAMYICEWIIADIGYLKTMTDNEDSAVKNVFDNILGTGIAGSIIWLIFTFMKRFI